MPTPCAPSRTGLAQAPAESAPRKQPPRPCPTRRRPSRPRPAKGSGARRVARTRLLVAAIVAGERSQAAAGKCLVHTLRAWRQSQSESMRLPAEANRAAARRPRGRWHTQSSRGVAEASAASSAVSSKMPTTLPRRDGSHHCLRSHGSSSGAPRADAPLADKRTPRSRRRPVPPAGRPARAQAARPMLSARSTWPLPHAAIHSACQRITAARKPGLEG